jgi:hypothetical protein
MMLPIRRRWAALILMLVVPALTWAAAPEWTASTIQDFWEYHALERKLEEEAGRSEALSLALDVVEHRIVLKESWMDEYDAGRIALPEFTQRFLTLHRERPCLYSVVPVSSRTVSEEEMIAAYVIFHLKIREGIGHPAAHRSRLRATAEFLLIYGREPMDF